MDITAFDLAQRFVGLREAPGVAANPQVLAMLRLDDPAIADDEIPWCSAFVNYVAWLLRLPRSKSLAARSWLSVGTPTDLAYARPDFDVVVLSRPSAGATAGHVGFFAGSTPDVVWLLGGNQRDAVSVAGFAADRILGVRRLV